MISSEIIEGQLLSMNGLILKVCKVVNYQCSYCVGFKKKALCRKLPDCSETFYFRKLNAFEVRKVKKAKKPIQEI